MLEFLFFLPAAADSMCRAGRFAEQFNIPDLFFQPERESVPVSFFQRGTLKKQPEGTDTRADNHGGPDIRSL